MEHVFLSNYSELGFKNLSVNTLRHEVKIGMPLDVLSKGIKTECEDKAMENMQKGTLGQPKFEPLTVKEKSISVVIVDDDEFYNALLKKEFHEFLKSRIYKNDYAIDLISFTDGHRCAELLKNGNFNNSIIIAFLDYYLQKGINGLQIYNLIKSLSPKNMAVIMTGTNDYRIWTKFEKQNSLVCLCKDEQIHVRCLGLLDKMLNNV